MSISELARRVDMSPPAVRERLSRLEEAAVIRGYRIDIDPAALGFSITAFIRVRPAQGQSKKVAALVRTMPEVSECHRVTGEDCYILKVHLASIGEDLDRIIDELIVPYGQDDDVDRAIDSGRPGDNFRYAQFSQWRNHSMEPVVLSTFDKPDEVRTFTKGRFEIVSIGGMTIGRATYEPGWIWSEHVGSSVGKRFCDVEHVGLVLAGRATAEMEDGRVIEMKAGDIFYIPPGHDSRVIGDEPYVSIHLMGASAYAVKH